MKIEKIKFTSKGKLTLSIQNLELALSDLILPYIIAKTGAYITSNLILFLPFLN